MRFRKIDPRTWRDEKFRQLDGLEKLIAIYALTAQSNRIGLFYFSVPMAADELGMSIETFRERFGNVCQTLSWRWDEPSKTLFLPTWWKYNPPENPNVLKGNLDDIHEIPATPLLSLFCGNTRYLPPKLRETFRERLANVTPQEQEQKQEQKQEQDHTPLPPKGGGGGEATNSQTPTEYQPPDPHSPEGLAVEWCHYTTRRRNRGRPMDSTDDAAPIMAELLRHGLSPANISEAIRDPKRNRSELLSEFSRRLTPKKAPTAATSETIAERFARIAREQRKELPR